MNVGKYDISVRKYHSLLYSIGDTRTQGGIGRTSRHFSGFFEKRKSIPVNCQLVYNDIYRMRVGFDEMYVVINSEKVSVYAYTPVSFCLQTVQ